ncbi:hypothetical protein JR316_0001693 [Psilocybe cubensis]|uniref:Uncharacterized protein n=3 Tax=Psilocybe cubensis TaxID=181762 RepID=A0A8H8CNV4_PSICU|nr:hypothetical protein JR316_0012520 [Psilocybe cubensis]XP_047752416.1 hypothetical protein JR316_0001693 [Psilocybe cubensis]KAH9475409.1 hypothetical protein JR316_0012520 [Psilocybe cubensis]KAH9484791.1 hypothetical protein JR316_0001693 [Psilocybe cubensis]
MSSQQVQDEISSARLLHEQELQMQYQNDVVFVAQRRAFNAFRNCFGKKVSKRPTQPRSSPYSIALINSSGDVVNNAHSQGYDMNLSSAQAKQTKPNVSLSLDSAFSDLHCRTSVDTDIDTLTQTTKTFTKPVYDTPPTVPSPFVCLRKHADYLCTNQSSFVSDIPFSGRTDANVNGFMNVRQGLETDTGTGPVASSQSFVDFNASGFIV